MTRIRGGQIARIFPDPASALNPLMSIGRKMAEALALHQALSGRALRVEALRLLGLVGIPEAGARLSAHPHEFSGGQSRRVTIAMALAGRPDLSSADAPNTALDGIIQAQIVDLRTLIRTETGMRRKPRPVRAVDDVSLHVTRGETLGVVGEPGSGKSTTGRMLLGLERPDSGRVPVDGAAMPALGSPAWRAQRVRMQMIFQDPMAALDRRLSIAAQIHAPLRIHAIGDASAQARRVQELLDAVGLRRDLATRCPNEVSGGQRQRAVLARALATAPDLPVCDEPVSALDVSVQAQVLNLLGDLQKQFGLTMVFISHDLRVVRQVSHRIAVMYLGRIVGQGQADDLFARPGPPYTRAWVSAAPTPGKTSASRIVLRGDPPNPANRPAGCAFPPRCPRGMDRCRTGAPPALTEAAPGRQIACHLVERSPERGAA